MRRAAPPRLATFEESLVDGFELQFVSWVVTIHEAIIDNDASDGIWFFDFAVLFEIPDTDYSLSDFFHVGLKIAEYLLFCCQAVFF